MFEVGIGSATFDY